MSNIVLVTGGAGFIGSHTCVALIEAGYRPLVFDNLSNSSFEVFQRLQTITGQAIGFVQGDICDPLALQAVFDQHDIAAVIHFAGLKAVGESVEQPLAYYQNNVAGTLNLLQAMAAAGVDSLVFSSSATVYGDPASNPIREDFPRTATNPYGQSKLTIEHILADLSAARPDWRIACLRYFNPVGAHRSGLIGEDPQGIPNNLVPFVAQVAVGRREYLSVFGGDYPTRDGTGVRDYIHVMDLAEGHVAALRYLEGNAGLLNVNLGTGQGVSVLEMLAAFEKACGKALPYQIVDRRPGDVAECYADAGLAASQLKWRASRTLEDMCEDVWRWQSGNPEGY
ncbi:UDP-glucose 4-epimerase GalE [Parahaliea aestuarii]|uniref:UDP-glucose 4-epimerase n=1 Tax=Parahaliea aestuarii TaxID=1852021 RepID=A0A5C8ZPA4_9GAMM|nr:UDP-glucose 4-epimerase GalE [Parahaliea aestuarii]TXS89397.1 UDP-glucose 4-epimerase GalE [Parahaliea aestuarii]